MWGTALAASSRSTVTRTISEPARARSAHWRAVPSMSAVSVLVIDCTTIGASPPMTMPPTPTGMETRGGRGELVIGLLRVHWHDAFHPGRVTPEGLPSAGAGGGWENGS